MPMSITTRPKAERLAGAIGNKFAVEIGGFFGRPAGPHPVANLAIAFAPAAFADVVPWLMMNRDGLDVLVHPLTDDPARDHDRDGLWLGSPVPLKPHGCGRITRPTCCPPPETRNSRMHRHEHDDRRHARGGMFARLGGHHRHDHRHGARGGRFGRFFDHGDLRYVLLGLIAEQPCHGYELIKAIEEKFGGLYSPSPGVIYPTLTLLEELGYIRPEGDDGTRKRFAATQEGVAFLAANRTIVDQIFARMDE